MFLLITCIVFTEHARLIKKARFCTRLHNNFLCRQKIISQEIEQLYVLGNACCGTLESEMVNKRL